MDWEYGLKLAIDIITNHFGNVVAVSFRASYLSFPNSLFLSINKNPKKHSESVRVPAAKGRTEPGKHRKIHGAKTCFSEERAPRPNPTQLRPRLSPSR